MLSLGCAWWCRPGLTEWSSSSKTRQWPVKLSKRKIINTALSEILSDSLEKRPRGQLLPDVASNLLLTLFLVLFPLSKVIGRRGL